MPRTIQPSLLCGALSFSALLIASGSFAECPQSSVSLIAKDNYNAVLFQSTRESDASSDRVAYGVGQTAASYNRLTRTIQSIADVYIADGYREISDVVVHERFVLQGAASATVTIRLSLVEMPATDPGARTAWVSADALLAASGQVVNAHADNSSHITPYIEIVTSMVEGVALDVTYQTTAQAWGNEPRVVLTGQLEFIGLPANAQVAPCSTTVPVRQSTWGAVKSLYRD